MLFRFTQTCAFLTYLFRFELLFVFNRGKNTEIFLFFYTNIQK